MALFIKTTTGDQFNVNVISLCEVQHQRKSRSASRSGPGSSNPGPVVHQINTRIGKRMPCLSEAENIEFVYTIIGCFEMPGVAIVRFSFIDEDVVVDDSRISRNFVDVISKSNGKRSLNVVTWQQWKEKSVISVFAQDVHRVKITCTWEFKMLIRILFYIFL